MEKDKHGNEITCAKMKTIVVSHPTEKKRYSLTKIWNDSHDAKRAATLLLNPSISMEIATDQSTNKCLNNILLKEKYDDFGSMEFVNLFPNQSKKRLLKSQYIFDDVNFQYICEALDRADLVIVGFGFGKDFTPDNRVIAKLREWKKAKEGREVLCFPDKFGRARHPRNVADDTPLSPYTFPKNNKKPKLAQKRQK